MNADNDVMYEEPKGFLGFFSFMSEYGSMELDRIVFQAE